VGCIVGTDVDGARGEDAVDCSGMVGGRVDSKDMYISPVFHPSFQSNLTSLRKEAAVDWNADGNDGIGAMEDGIVDWIGVIGAIEDNDDDGNGNGLVDKDSGG
jgi:hypothetical protein